LIGFDEGYAGKAAWNTARAVEVESGEIHFRFLLA